MLHPRSPPAPIHLAQFKHPTITYSAIHANDNNPLSAFTWPQKHPYAHSTAPALSCSTNSQHGIPVDAHYLCITSTFGPSTRWTINNLHGFKPPFTSQWTNLQPNYPYAVAGLENCDTFNPQTGHNCSCPQNPHSTLCNPLLPYCQQYPCSASPHTLPYWQAQPVTTLAHYWSYNTNQIRISAIHLMWMTSDHPT